jgi:hypothetical protein
LKLREVLSLIQGFIMKNMFIVLFACILWNGNLYSGEYIWKKIRNQGTFYSEKLGLSSTAFDRTNNIIYSMKYVNDVMTVMAYDINRDTIYTIPNEGAPNGLGSFTFDQTNDRLIAVRSGREHIYALPVSGGTWTKIGNGTFDGESYGAGYFWNEKSNSFGYFGGYGYFSVKNWVWEYQDSWKNVFENNSNIGSTVPAKRSGSIIPGKPGENKVYFSSGAGNASGDQFEQECTISEPWANDVGTYCWLKDVWELDLNTHTFKNLLPVNHASIKSEGVITYDHDEKVFVKIGGFIPSATYQRGDDWAKNTEYDMEISVFTEGSSDGFMPIQTSGDLPPVLKLSELQHNALFYDGKGKRVMYIRGDGIWSLSKSVDTIETKACGFTIREQDTTICMGTSLNLHITHPNDSTCLEPETVCSIMPYEKKVGNEIYVSVNGNDVTGNGTSNKPFKTIQFAIEQAKENGIITVLDGTYTGQGNTEISLKGKTLTVQSQNGALCTIIDCEKQGRAFNVHEGETMASVIQGFTIKNGSVQKEVIVNASPNLIISNDTFQLSKTEEPLDWKTAEEVQWITAQGPFGNGYKGSFATNTNWPLGTTMFLRKKVTFDHVDKDNVTYRIAVDNGFKLYLNGNLIKSAMKEYNPNRWDFTGTINKEFMKDGENILALEIIDKGVQSYFEINVFGTLIKNDNLSQTSNDRGNLVYVDNHSGITLKNCIFESNADGEDLAFGLGEVYNQAESVIESSVFRNITGNGIVILSDKKTVTINECVFDGNSKVLHANAHYSNPPSQISNCVFKNNTADHLVEIHHSKTLTNSIFANNKTTIGVVYAATSWSGPSLIDHTIFYNNSSVYLHNPTLDHIGIVKNSIFSGIDNNGRNHISGNQDAITFEYSNGTGFTGVGNIETDPQFVNPSAYDFRLSQTSSLIGAGEHGSDIGVDMSKFPQWMLDSIHAVQPKRTIISYEWSTGSTDSTITVTPSTATTYFLTTKHGNNVFVDSIRVEVSEAFVDIFGQTKIHQRQVNHAYYTEFHEGSIYQWEVTGNAELASSNGGSSILVNFKDPGLAYIKVTETNKYACMKDTMITVRVYGLTDIDEGVMGNVSMMSVFPNPVGNEDIITVRAMMTPGRNGVIDLIDVLGTQLFSVPTYAQDFYQEYTTQIPIGEFPNGMYMIRYNDGEQTVMEKLLINR